MATDIDSCPQDNIWTSCAPVALSFDVVHSISHPDASGFQSVAPLVDPVDRTAEEASG